jgi:prepilin-type processing-associated H-X9-DG protein
MSFVGTTTSSYGFNGWLYGCGDALSQHDMAWLVRMPDRIPVFADANYVEGSPRQDDPFPADPLRGSVGDEPQMGRFCIARHGESINAAFLDGHAEQVPLRKLWELHWIVDKPADVSPESSDIKPSVLP